MDYQSEYKDLYRNNENIYEETGEFINEINDYLKKKIILNEISGNSNSNIKNSDISNV
jgi:hypothetical protein